MIQILAYERRMGVRRVVSRIFGGRAPHGRGVDACRACPQRHSDGLEPERQGFFRDVWVLGNKRS
jgi:hypothetical protein